MSFARAGGQAQARVNSESESYSSSTSDSSSSSEDEASPPPNKKSKRLAVQQKESQWQFKCKKWRQRGNELLRKEKWSDCAFKITEDSTPVVLNAHKLILAAASPVFETMFYGNVAEINFPIIITDIGTGAFKAMLQYVYTDDVNISCCDMACDLLYCARKYMLCHLEKRCLDYLAGKVNYKNVCKVYEFGVLYEAKKLLKKCQKVFSISTLSILKSSGFLEAQLNTVKAIFSMDYLAIDSELDLIQAMERYNKAKVDNAASKEGTGARAVSIRNAVEKIRFLTLTGKQFANGAAKSSLLTESDAYAIFMNIHNTKGSVPMPKGFSTSRLSRKRELSMKKEDIR